MKRIEFTGKAKVQAAVVGAAAVLLVLCGVTQVTGIGQAYQCVRINGTQAGFVPGDMDVKKVMQEARREISLETGERVSVELDWGSDTARRPFRKFLSEDELKEVFKDTIREENAGGMRRAYTVAIDGYRANFSTLEEVEKFLNEVKAPLDETGAYRTEMTATDWHISGIMTAVLEETAPETDVRTIPEETLADTLSSGAQSEFAYALAYAQANPSAGAYQTGILDLEFVENVRVEETLADTLSSGAQSEFAYALAYAQANPSAGAYQTGILDLEFVENVRVYENFVAPEELCDIEEQVAEVTKQKESNKIYVVQSGDCLSVIAMDHDTTVDSIVKLNGMSDPDQMIRDGQELVIAVPEPDLQLLLTMGEVYEEDYTEEPTIIENDSWYTTKEVVHDEGTVGHRERNDVVVYQNGMEVSREMIHENIMVASAPAVIERGTVVPPTYIKPIAGGRFTSGFGRRWGRMHKGTDWACPVGTTVYASCGGTVIQASYSGGYGNCVVISHPDGRMTRYAHNSKLLVKTGQQVEQGEAIALSGNTGRSTGPHVHFELYINGSAVDALKYISY